MASRRAYEHIKSQREIRERQSDICVVCFDSISPKHGHHITFHSLDGSSGLRNFATLCESCHRDYHAGTLKIDLSSG